MRSENRIASLFLRDGEATFFWTESGILAKEAQTNGFSPAIN
jgi:hypothetical protein